MYSLDIVAFRGQHAPSSWPQEHHLNRRTSSLFTQHAGSSSDLCLCDLLLSLSLSCHLKFVWWAGISDRTQKLGQAKPRHHDGFGTSLVALPRLQPARLGIQRPSRQTPNPSTRPGACTRGPRNRGTVGCIKSRLSMHLTALDR